MGEALLRAMGGYRVEVESAGSMPSRVHPLAVRTMAERGLDISAQESKHLDTLRGKTFDHVITVCDAAAANCPVFPGPALRTHWSLPDPAAVEGSEEKRLRAFRDIARRLEELLADFLAGLPEPPAGGSADAAERVADPGED